MAGGGLTDFRRAKLEKNAAGATGGAQGRIRVRSRSPDDDAVAGFALRTWFWSRR
jgi:hypothetical protein